MTTRALTHAEGEQRKADALNTLEANRESIVLRGRRLLLEAMLAGDGRATADDIRDRLDLPRGIDPKVCGTIPGALAHLGLIERIGYQPSARPEAHARPVSVWQLSNRQAALRWLAEHPEPDAPEPAMRQRDLFAPAEPWEVAQ